MWFISRSNLLTAFLSVLAEDAIKAALSDYRLKQDKKEERVQATS